MTDPSMVPIIEPFLKEKAKRNILGGNALRVDEAQHLRARAYVVHRADRLDLHARRLADENGRGLIAVRDFDLALARAADLGEVDGRVRH